MSIFSLSAALSPLYPTCPVRTGSFLFAFYCCLFVFLFLYAIYYFVAYLFFFFCSYEIIFITYFFCHFFSLPLLYYKINCVFLFFY